MPRSRIAKGKMFREFSKMKQKYLGYTFLKNIRKARKDTCEKNNISASHLEFLLWGYDLEFFTARYASQEYGIREKNILERIIYPLQRNKYLYKQFDKLTPSQTEESHLFREETKYNYRVRYALTQKARLLVQRMYNDLIGSED